MDEAGKENVPQTHQTEDQAIPSDDKPIDRRHLRKGVGGWLLLLCLALSVVRSLGLLASVAQALTPSTNRLLYLLYALEFAFGASAGILLWSKARIAVSYAKAYWIVHPYATLFLWARMVGIDSSTSGQAISVIGISVIFSFIWFSYLTFSKRVRNTYDVDSGKRNVLVSMLMGAALGPLGSVYFHIRIMVMTALASIAAVLIALLGALVIGFRLPPWMSWVWLGFFPLAYALFATSWNEAETTIGPEDINWEAAVAFGMTLGIWEFRIIGVSTGIYGAVTLFGQGRILLGIVSLVAIPWALNFIAQGIMTLIVAIAGLAAALRKGAR